MYKGKIRVGILVVLILLGGLIDKEGVLADSNELTFSVRPVLPENQVKDLDSYIAIDAGGDSIRQELEFIVTNESNKVEKVTVDVVNAYTSPNGNIQYDEEESENSEIILEEYQLTEYVEIHEDVITLKPKEEKKLKVLLDVDDLTGTLLGGVSFSSLTEEDIKEEESTFTIENKINMVVGVLVNFKDKGKEEEFNIGIPYLEVLPSYYVIRLPLELESPTLLKGVGIDYEVLHKGEVLFKGNKEYDYAPNTKSNILLPFDYEEIHQDTYEIKGTIFYMDRDGVKKQVPFSEEFKYEGMEDDKGVFGKITKPLESNGGIVGTIIVVISIIIIIYNTIKYLRRIKGKER